jgi:hypothetical protein
MIMVIFVIGEPKRLINKSITNKTIKLKKNDTSLQTSFYVSKKEPNTLLSSCCKISLIEAL